MAIVEREPRYGTKKITLRGRQPLIFELPFTCDFLTFIDISEIDPDKVYVAFNTPATYVQVSRSVVVQLPVLVLRRLLFRWDLDQTGKSLTFYYAGAPSIHIGVTTVTIGGDFVGLAREATLLDIKNAFSTLNDKINVNLDTRASESTLSALNAKIPSPIDDVFSKDVSVGASAVQLDPDIKVREAITLLADAANTDDILIGNSASQAFPLSPGSSLTLRKCSLSKIYAIAVSGTQILHVITGGI